MADKFFNLSLTGTGGEGSMEDPWHADDFFSILHAATDDDWYVRGSANVSTGYHIVTGNKIFPWGEPYRIHTTSWFHFGGESEITGMILEASADNISIGYSNLNSCFLHVVSGGKRLLVNEGSPRLSGCTIVGNFDFSYSAFGDTTVMDSILDGTFVTSVNPVQYLTIINSCLSTVSLPSFHAGTEQKNYQLGWTPPAWPAWDDSQSAFCNSILSVGIDTPPQPGNPPYTGYVTGLWDSSRVGIGAMYFDTTTPDPTTTTPAPTTTIEASIINYLRSDSILGGYISSYCGSSAVFSEEAPEDATTPFVVVRITRSSTEAIPVQDYNFYIDYYDYNVSRSDSRAAIERIEMLLDRHTFKDNSHYNTIRCNYFSGSPVEDMDPRNIHYNLQFYARAGRKNFVDRS